MNSQINYTCSNCGQRKKRDNLLVKKVGFYEMGSGGKMVRSRVVGWICKDDCIPTDPEWNQTSHKFQNKQKATTDA